MLIANPRTIKHVAVNRLVSKKTQQMLDKMSPESRLQALPYMWQKITLRLRRDYLVPKIERAMHRRNPLRSPSDRPSTGPRRKQRTRII